MAGVDVLALVDATFRRAQVGTAITDAAGGILEANEALCSFLGQPAAKLTSMSFRDFTFPDDLPASLEELRRLCEGSSSGFVLEKRYVTGTGTQVWGRVTGTAVRDESGALARVITQVEDLSERRAGEAALSDRGLHDQLTGLANRVLFYERLRSALDDPRRSARRIAVLVVNLNRFHQINAGLGQPAADLVLREVGRRLGAVTRGQDCAARLGGDEFAVLARDIATVDGAIALALKIRYGLMQPHWAAENPVVASARIGCVTAPGDGTDAETLVSRAMAATRTAKALSGGWAMHIEGADTPGREKLGHIGDLRAAIDDGEITVAYQPIVDSENRLHCLEVLARWHHPERGAVPPDQFISLAEQSDLITALTRRILTTAIQQGAAWGSPNLPVPIAVNLSGKLLGHPHLVEETSRVLASAGLPAGALTFEITETAFADGGNPEVWAGLAALRETGVRISVDDFGTGYCTLAYLKQLPIDEIKIDRSFIVDFGSDPRSERIVRAIIDLAHSLDLSVVSEGVEDEAIAASLLRMGVDYLQGFFIARPATSQLTTDWLETHSLAPAGRPARRGGRASLNVLVVDDDMVIGAGLHELLTSRHHRVVEAHSGTAALDQVSRHMPDVIILDQLMPDLTGVQTAPRLREAGYAGPVLLYSDSPPGTLAGSRFPLDVWPVSKADKTTLLRLIDGYAGDPRDSRHARPKVSTCLGWPGLSIDTAKREVLVNEQVVGLTHREFDLLAYFASAPRQVFSRHDLLLEVWHSSPEWQTTKTVTEHIRRVRQKIGASPTGAPWITTVPRAGYRFDP